MTPASYAIWVLVLQTAAYSSYLNFGLQTAVGRYVAYANEKKDIELRDAVFSTALAGLCFAALASLVCLLVVVLAAPVIFPSVPSLLIPQMRLALLIVGFSMTIELPASGWNGVFIGLARYEIPAIIVGGARLLAALGLIGAALAGRSLVFMAAIIAAMNLLSYFTLYLALRSVAPDIRFQRALITRSTAGDLYNYCFGLTVMSFAMLLITGLDLVLVGRFEFAVVTPYSVSNSVVAVIAGLLGAVISVILPHAASLHAREQPDEMGKLVVYSTRLSVLLLILTGMPILIYARPILRLWIGPQYVFSGVPLLTTLIVANVVRLIGLPYATILVAAGQQNYIKISPLSEGISNFVASIVLGTILGGIGVALGTLLGSFVSLGTHFFYSMVRTRGAIALSRRALVVSGVLFPILSTSPLLVTAVASLRGFEIRPFVFGAAALLSIIGAAVVVLGTKGIFAQRRLLNNNSTFPIL